MAVGEIKPGQDDLRLGRERKVFKQDKVCYSWLAGNCKRGDNCKFLHSYVFGAPFVTFLTQLTGHEKAIGGFAFRPNSGKFYSGGLEGILRVWDSQTGECTSAIDLGGEIGCLHSEGPWVFAGLPNPLKAWNNLTSAELNLSGPRGQVHALTVGNQILFAATQVWDLGTFECTQILEGHTSVVMSLLFWDQFLLSCSLDMTVKVWVAASGGSLEVTYTQNEDQGVLALCGIYDEQAKSVLLCSCNDNSVCLYDLPSFNKRGRIFSQMEVRAFQLGPDGLFFTGDGLGEIKVWKYTMHTEMMICSNEQQV